MTHYIFSFIVYTLAMSGIIGFALIIYKKVTKISTSNKKTKELSIEETMSINPRKTLMIVKAGEERFLIASDVDKTTLISKLNQNDSIAGSIGNKGTQSVQNSIVDLNGVKNSIDNKNMNVLFPQKIKTANKKTPSAASKTSTAKTTSKKDKTVHLEVITNKNPKGAELRRPRSYMQTRRRNVTIEVGEIKNHGFSTIKEMAHKINEI